MLSRTAGRLLTGRLAFLVSGLIDFGLALGYLLRFTIRSRWDVQEPS